MSAYVMIPMVIRPPPRSRSRPRPSIENAAPVISDFGKMSAGENAAFSRESKSGSPAEVMMLLISIPRVPVTRHSTDERQAVLGDWPETCLPRFDRRGGERRRDVPAQRFDARVRTLVRCNVGRIDGQRSEG